MNQNNQLPAEVLERIKADAERYSGLMVWVNQDPEGNQPLFHEYISSTSYIAGATAEAEMAQMLVDALQELVDLKRMKDEGINVKEYLDRKPAAWEAAINALQQWKQGNEVVSVETDEPSLSTCMECKHRPAVKDYNGHGHYVCRQCDDYLNREFDEEYR